MDKKEIKEKIELLETTIRTTNVVIDSLTAQLAESEKPALRHGDYGVGDDGFGWAILKRDGDLEIFGQQRGSGCNAKENDKELIGQRLGNIFDDLAAMSEDVEEFEICHNKASFNEYGHLKIKYLDGEYIVIRRDDIHAFILNLRRMEATDIRKK